MKHTKGKWILNEYYSEVRDEQGFLIHRSAPINATNFTKEEKLANARLIAAAPELLAQLKSMTEAIEEGRINQDHITTAKEIIAKAT